MQAIQFQLKKNEPEENFFFLKSFSFLRLLSSDRALTTAVKGTNSLAKDTGIWEGLRGSDTFWGAMTTSALAVKESSNFKPSSTTTPVTRSLSVRIYVVNNS